MSADGVFCSCHQATPKSLLMLAPRTYVCSRAREFDVSPDALLGTGKSRHLVMVRAAIAAELRKRGYSLPAIGRALNRHHTSVINLLLLADSP